MAGVTSVLFGWLAIITFSSHGELEFLLFVFLIYVLCNLGSARCDDRFGTTGLICFDQHDLLGCLWSSFGFG